MAVYRFFDNAGVDWRETSGAALAANAAAHVSLFFDPDEIEAAYLLPEKTPPAQPGLNDVLRQIACVGCILARKGNGELGVKTIWLG